MQSRTPLTEYTQRLRDAWGPSQSHAAGLGARPGALLLRCPMPAPPCRLLLCKSAMHWLVRQTGAEEPAGVQGGGCAHWPGTGVAGGRRGHTQGPASGGGGRCPSCSRDSSHPSRSRQQSTRRSAVIGDFFNSLSPLNPLTFKASTYGPVPSPRVRLTLDPRAGTAGLAKDQQPLFSLFASLCSRGSIHFANGTWSPCILGEPMLHQREGSVALLHLALCVTPTAGVESPHFISLL